MNSFVEQACSRVDDFLSRYDSDQPAEILADLIHYCWANNLDFDTQLRFANGYVKAELEAESEVDQTKS